MLHFDTQALIVDLGETKNVTGIATQGRSHTREFVIEFRIQYGSNGRDWIDYKEARDLHSGSAFNAMS